MFEEAHLPYDQLSTTIISDKCYCSLDIAKHYSDLYFIFFQLEKEMLDIMEKEQCAMAAHRSPHSTRASSPVSDTGQTHKKMKSLLVRLLMLANFA